MQKRRILFVEDDPVTRFSVADFLDASGYVVDQAEDLRRAELLFRANPPDAVLADYNLPDGNALELLQRLKLLDPAVPVVVLTGNATVDLAVRAIKEGAQNFLTKPVELPTLNILFDRLIEEQRSRRKAMAVRRDRDPFDPFIGVSASIQRLRDVATTVAASESSVLILGETGAGKGVLARWLHDHSTRADEAYVDLNCAGLNREFLESELFGHEKGAFTGAVSMKQGLLEVAHRGTVFLDEIGDVDPQVQPKLLKVLEEKSFRRLGETKDRRVDIRLIAATHQDLTAAARDGRFRDDLYFRISTIPLRVPPLRDRREDIPVIARSILTEITGRLGKRDVQLGTAAEDALRRYAWPGNIRELRNVIERAVILSPADELEVRHLIFDDAAPCTRRECNINRTLEEVEACHIERVLEAEGGNVDRAAKRLQIPRSTLYYRIKQGQVAKR